MFRSLKLIDILRIALFPNMAREIAVILYNTSSFGFCARFGILYECWISAKKK